MIPAGRRLVLGAALLAGLATGAADAAPAQFAALPGWAADDHLAAFRTFRRDCGAVVARRPRSAGGVDGRALARACGEALAMPAPDAGAARRFFETRFRPRALAADGFVTGYFEPEIDGALAPAPGLTTPLYRMPGDGGTSFERSEIDAGALAGRGLELVYVADPVTAFFVHVQGSTRVRLTDGTAVRIGFAGKNGLPYTAIGRILIERGEIAREEMTAARLEAWLRAHPDEAPALMAANRSYIFFRRVEGLDPGLGPAGSLGTQLTPGRSMAVDPAALPLGTPVFVTARLPLGPGGAEVALRRLVVADDTGSAIKGAGRGDLFLGWGAEAGAAAGRLRHPAGFVVLVPRAGGGDGG